MKNGDAVTLTLIDLQTPPGVQSIAEAIAGDVQASRSAYTLELEPEGDRYVWKGRATRR